MHSLKQEDSLSQNGHGRPNIIGLGLVGGFRLAVLLSANLMEGQLCISDT